MKKLIISAIAAVSLLFGFASCSGDLHDEEVPKHEPVTIDGAAWYYYDLTVYGDNKTEGNFILNGSVKQSVDTAMPEFTAKTGGVFYFTADVSKKDADGKYTLLTSYQSDNPAYTAVPGTVRFYIYTNETSCNIYCFGNDNSFATMDGNWPGVAMTKNGEIAKETYDAKATLKSITITGLPDELNGKEIYLTGDPVGWADPGATGSIKVTISSNKISLTDLNMELSVASVEVGQIGTQEMKFAAAGWSKPEVTAAGGNNFKINVSDGAEINLVGAYTGTKDGDAQVYCCVFGQ